MCILCRSVSLRLILFSIPYILSVDSTSWISLNIKNIARSETIDIIYTQIKSKN